MTTVARCQIAVLALALLGAPQALAAGAALPIPTAAPAPPASPAQEGARPGAAEPPPVLEPRAIPLEAVFREADELVDAMRRSEAARKADPAVAEAERLLAEAAQVGQLLRPDLAPLRLQEASARELTWLRGALARQALALVDAQVGLERRAAALAAVSRELQARFASWRLTAATAAEVRAPDAVLAQVARAEEGLGAETARLRVHQDRLFELQGKVSALRGELGRSLAAVDEADAALSQQLFQVEGAPLWRALAAPGRAVALGAHLRQAVRESRRDAATFRAEERGHAWIHLAVVGALGLGLVLLRRPVAGVAAGDPALRGPSRMLARPWSAALLLSAPIAAAIYGPLPPTLRDVFGLLLLAPLLRLLPDLVPPVFRRPLFWFAALFALGRLAAIAPPRTLLERLVLLAVTAGALLVLARGLRPGGWARFVRGGAWGIATRAAALLAVGMLSASAVAGVIGNVALAERLTHTTVGGALLAALLVGVLSVLEGAVAALLLVPAVRRRPIVARHGDLLRTRMASLFRLGAVAVWAWAVLSFLGVAGAVGAAGRAVLDLRLAVGGLDVSLGNVVAFVATLGLAVLVARTLRFVLDEGVFPEVALPRGIPAAVSKTFQYVVLVVGFSWAVLASGMEMSRFSFLVGALGVGIGFGLQNVVNNFVSGLILVYERPVQVGDVVEVGAVAGEVTRIGVRSSTVRTFPGAEVIVPNATLISAEVTNWTLSDKKRRVELAVGVAYGTPPQQVIDLLLAAVRGRAGVLLAPAPVALFMRFGESAIEFVLRFWTADFDRWQQLASDVLIEVHASLGRAGIEIPFPQRDLHIRTVDAGVSTALGGGTRDGGSEANVMARGGSEPHAP
jgi:small-conductance mechanosensitive channel